MSIRPYPEYRDSGVEWLGEIPFNWHLAPLKVLASFNDEVLAETTDPDYQFHYIEISDVSHTDGITFGEPIKFSSAASRARRIVREGDVLVSTVRTYLRAIASARSIPHDTIASTGFAVLRPKACDARFLSYGLLAEHFIGEVISRSVGVSYPAINATDLVNVKIPVPRQEEQWFIANYLDRETAEIDAFIADQENLVTLLSERRTATITRAVTKGLDPHSPMKDSGVEWIGEIPQKWSISRFSRCVQINAGQVDPKSSKFSEMYLVAPNHVESETGRLIKLETAVAQGAESGKYLVRAGQVIYSKIRPNLMKTVIAPVDCLCSADMYGLEADKNQLSNQFLKYLLLSRPFHDYAVDQSMRVAMPKLNHDSLGAAPVCLPSLLEQRQIVDFIETEIDAIDAAIADAREAIALSKERRAAVISAAVTGKIDVRGLAASTADDVEGASIGAA